MNSTLLSNYYAPNSKTQINYPSTPNYYTDSNSKPNGGIFEPSSYQKLDALDRSIKIKHNFIKPTVLLEFKGNIDTKFLQKELKDIFQEYGAIEEIEIKKEDDKIKVFISYCYFFSALFAYESIMTMLDNQSTQSNLFIKILKVELQEAKRIPLDEYFADNLRDQSTAKKSNDKVDVKNETNDDNFCNNIMKEDNVKSDYLSFSKQSVPSSNFYPKQEYFSELKRQMQMASNALNFSPTLQSIIINSQTEGKRYFVPNDNIFDILSPVTSQKTFAKQNEFKAPPAHFLKTNTNFLMTPFNNEFMTNFPMYMQYDPFCNSAYFSECSHSALFPFQSSQNVPIYLIKYNFQTLSSKEYHHKFVCNYSVQIENEEKFNVKKRILGPKGNFIKKIINDCCIINNDYTTKIRLRGKGSGYKEGPQQMESADPLELCISSLNFITYQKVCIMIERLLLKIYNDYYTFLYYNNTNIEKLTYPTKIQKYAFVVTREQ